MYVFEYHDQIYYISVEKITAMIVGPYIPSVSYSGLSRYHNTQDLGDHWTLVIYFGDAREIFRFDTKEEAQTLAGIINNMHSAMFDARIGND